MTAMHVAEVHDLLSGIVSTADEDRGLADLFEARKHVEEEATSTAVSLPGDPGRGPGLKGPRAGAAAAAQYVELYVELPQHLCGVTSDKADGAGIALTQNIPRPIAVPAVNIPEGAGANGD